MSNSGGPEREYIVIDPAAYAKKSGGRSSPRIDQSRMLANFVDRLDMETTATSGRGPEDVTGTPALAYTFTYTNTVNGALITNHDKIRVGAASGLPVKQVVDGETSGTAYHSEQVIEHDSTITIEAPI
ncbi:MAG: hypothetical protein JW748_13350 [Anaerolineales bacterium]|nr:hypothetical protein [Anaerolineales bacterium]